MASGSGGSASRAEPRLWRLIPGLPDMQTLVWGAACLTVVVGVTYAEHYLVSKVERRERSGRVGQESRADFSPASANSTAPATEQWMSFPLITTGPGGVYTTRYVPHGSRLLAVDGDESSQHGEEETGQPRSRYEDADQFIARHRQKMNRDTPRPPTAAAGPRTLLDRLLGIDRVVLSPEALAARTDPTIEPVATCMGSGGLHAAARSWLSGQLTVLDQVHRFLEQLRPRPAFACLDGAAHPCVFDVVRPNRTIGLQEYSDEPHSQATQNPPTDPGLTSSQRLLANDARARPRTRRQQSDRLRARRSADKKRRIAARGEQGSLFVHL